VLGLNTKLEKTEQHEMKKDEKKQKLMSLILKDTLSQVKLRKTPAILFRRWNSKKIKNHQI
jgi:hypothetical protein